MRKEAPKGKVSGLSDPALTLGVMEMQDNTAAEKVACLLGSAFSFFGTDGVKSWCYI